MMISISKQQLNQIIIDSGSKKHFWSKESPVFAALREVIASTAGDDIDYNKVLLCFIQNPLKPIHPQHTFFTHIVVEPENSDFSEEAEHDYSFNRDPFRDEDKTPETRAFFVLQRVLEEVQLTLPAYAVEEKESVWSRVRYFNFQRAVLIACFISLNNSRLVKLFSAESDVLSLVTTLFTLVDVIFPDDSESRYYLLARGMITLANASERLCNHPNHSELFRLGAALGDLRFFDESMQFFDALGSRADLIAIIDAINEARKSKVAGDQLFTLLKTLPTDLVAQIKALEVEAHNLDARRSLISEVFGSLWVSSGDRDYKRIYTKIQRHANPVLALQLIQLYNQFSIDKNDREILLSHRNLAKLAAIQPQLTALQQSALVSTDAMLAIVRFTLQDPYPSDTMTHFITFKRQVEQLRADGCSHAMIDLVEAQVILGMIRSVGSDLVNESIDGYLRALNTKLRAEIPRSALASTPPATLGFFAPQPSSQSVGLNAQLAEISTVDDDLDVVQGLA